MSIKRWLREEWIAVTIIALSVLVQVCLVTRPLDFLLTNLIDDDAFYYFQVVRHILDGAGSTFDGIHSANGYHPFWMVLLIPVFALFSNGGTLDVAPIQAALALSVLLNAVGSVFFVLILKQLIANTYARAFAIFLWALNPFVLYELLNGLETSLATMLFMVFALLVVCAREAIDTRSALLLGVGGGLMVLARLDLAFYVGALCLWLLYRFRLPGVRLAIIVGCTSALIIAPCILWNYANFAMLLTAASHAAPMVNHELVARDNGVGTYQTLKSVAFHTVYGLRSIVRQTGLPFFLLFTTGLFLVLLWKGRREIEWRELHPVVSLYVGAGLLFVANASVRWTMREWYFISVISLFVILAAYVLERTNVFGRSARTMFILFVLIASGGFYLGWRDHLHNAMQAQRLMYEASAWLNSNVSAGVHVGVFNAGIQAYFSHARVINLDGLINNSAYDAMRERRLWAYAKESGIEYVSDFDLYMTYRYKAFLGADPYEDLTLVRSIYGEGAHGADSLNIYRVAD